MGKIAPIASRDGETPGRETVTVSSLAPAASAIELRGYQLDALAAIEAAERRGVRRQLVVMATGMGKTIVFSELVRRRRPGRCLVIAHREELLDQARDKLLVVDPTADVGIVQAGRDETDARIVVASIQTLARQSRLDRIGRDFATIVVDEAHHAPAESYVKLLDSLGALEPDGPLTLGFTATGERGDKAALGGVFQEIVYELGILQGMADG